jgi:hypothetical protein
MLAHKARYFVVGGVIGGRAFVEEVFREKRRASGRSGRRGASDPAMRGAAVLAAGPEGARDRVGGSSATAASCHLHAARRPDSSGGTHP